MIEENDILKKFEKLKDQKLYKVPDTYFNALSEKVQDKIANEKGQKQRVFIFKPKPVLAVVFFALGIFFIGYLGLKETLPFWNAGNTRQMKHEEIVLYLDELDELDDATLAAEVYDDPMGSQKSLETDNTEEYLLNNDIAINEILNEL